MIGTRASDLGRHLTPASILGSLGTRLLLPLRLGSDQFVPMEGLGSIDGELYLVDLTWGTTGCQDFWPHTVLGVSGRVTLERTWQCELRKGPWPEWVGLAQLAAAVTRTPRLISSALSTPGRWGWDPALFLALVSGETSSWRLKALSRQLLSVVLLVLRL